MAKYMIIGNMSFETTEYSTTWLADGLGFTYVKVFYEIAREYAHSGKVTFSNEYFIRAEEADLKGANIKRTERAIQWAFAKLEEAGLIERVYSNDKKTHRTEIKVNEMALLETLGMKPGQADSLDRGNVRKHIRQQMPAFLKPSKIKSLIRRVNHEKNDAKRKELQAQIDLINDQYRVFDEYITKLVEKNQKYVSVREVNTKSEVSDERIAMLRQILPSWGVKPYIEVTL
jgi:uncharacterized protein YPO0396